MFSWLPFLYCPGFEPELILGAFILLMKLFPKALLFGLNHRPAKFITSVTNLRIYSKKVGGMVLVADGILYVYA